MLWCNLGVTLWRVAKVFKTLSVPSTERAPEPKNEAKQIDDQTAWDFFCGCWIGATCSFNPRVPSWSHWYFHHKLFPFFLDAHPCRTCFARVLHPSGLCSSWGLEMVAKRVPPGNAIHGDKGATGTRHTRCQSPPGGVRLELHCRPQTFEACWSKSNPKLSLQPPMLLPL